MARALLAPLATALAVAVLLVAGSAPAVSECRIGTLLLHASRSLVLLARPHLHHRRPPPLRRRLP